MFRATVESSFARDGAVAGVDQARRRCCGEATDQSHRRTLNLRRNDFGRRDFRQLDSHLEPEGHVGHLGFKHRIEAFVITGRQIAHTLNAGCKKVDVLEFCKHGIARCANCNLPGEFHYFSVAVKADYCTVSPRENQCANP